MWDQSYSVIAYICPSKKYLSPRFLSQNCLRQPCFTDCLRYKDMTVQEICPSRMEVCSICVQNPLDSAVICLQTCPSTVTREQTASQKISTPDFQREQKATCFLVHNVMPGLLIQAYLEKDLHMEAI